jgi:hypothetical protein
MTALKAEERHSSIPEADDIYGNFIGEWDFEWVSNAGTPKEFRVKGEWLFIRALEGRAIADLFICPSREERKREGMPEGEYGLSVRTYSPETRTWHVCYSCDGKPDVLESALVQNGDIIHNLVNKNYKSIWSFTEITNTSFHWSNRTSSDSGKTWVTVGDVYATRRSV